MSWQVGQHETIQILQGSRDDLAGSIPLMWCGDSYLNRTWLGICGRQKKWFINLRERETHLGGSTEPLQKTCTWILEPTLRKLI